MFRGKRPVGSIGDRSRDRAGQVATGVCYGAGDETEVLGLWEKRENRRADA